MDAANTELLSVTVDIWHPDCWTLDVTDKTDAVLLGHGTTAHGTGVAGRYEIHGESHDAVEALIAATHESKLVEEASTLPPSTSGAATASTPSTRDFLVEFDPEPSIRKAFNTRGFIHQSPSWHENGRERRTLLARADRHTVQRELDDIEAAYDADIELQTITTVTPPNSSHEPIADRLSPRQREALQLARARGYYEYPRATTTRALAAELDISKTTFLEHLRKAEAKLLTAINLD